MATSANLGFPRIGAHRELKKALEDFWKGIISEDDLRGQAKKIREGNLEFQKKCKINRIPVNDFSFYDDKGLDMIALLGAVPAAYGHKNDDVELATYFAMCRGVQKAGIDIKAMEMSKFFDTNYHYIVPEFTAGQNFALSANKIFAELEEAKKLGIEVCPVIIGPLTFLLQGKAKTAALNPLDLLDRLVPVYVELLQKLQLNGATSVQIDEPFLVMDLGKDVLRLYEKTYQTLAKASGLVIHLTTYFGDLRDNLDVAINLPVKSLHIDLCRAPQQLDRALAQVPAGLELSLGVVDGRNVWKNDFANSLKLLTKAADKIGSERIIIAPSCSLLHSPVSLNSEKNIDETVKDHLSFATQKVQEIADLTALLNNNGKDTADNILQKNQESAIARKKSTAIHDQKVKERVLAVKKDMFERKSNYETRQKLQAAELKLPLLPTTTIGSFPQTKEVRKVRAEFKKKQLSEAKYIEIMQEEILKCIKFQEKIDIDVLVHGEFERNDMVEYFGENLNGFAISENGWVQSYGSRCVKPPIIYGDVSRPKAMTVSWSEFAQKNSKKIMKGMLTGPVTILQWSFVRDDQPRSETCKQIALAIRDEVADLEQAGIKIIQIDEAAIREGLPLRKDEWQAYLRWAVDSFKLTAACVKDSTQIHTHMCYSEFNDIIEAVADMDADVISIETSRSQMELLDAFIKFKYPNEIGPGVYDIHSPRVPTEKEMVDLLHVALQRISADKLWVNPDCGLKTRDWKEVELALVAMVNAAKQVRKDLADGKIQKIA